MAEAEWRVLIADTITGEIRADVAYIGDPNFDRTINEKGSLSVSAYIDATPNTQVDFHAYTRPGMYSWILAYGTSIVQAGPVWSYTFTDSSRTLEVTCGGMFSLFDRRVTRNPQGSANDPVPAIVNESEDLHYTGLSLRGIMRQLVADNLEQLYYAMPSIVLPEAEAGDAERNYLGYDLKMIGDNMTDLAGVINGPEFDFAPEFTADGAHIQWRLKIGSPMLGDQATTAVWDYGVEGAPINAIDVDADGSNSPITRAWVKGDGDDRTLLTGFAEDLTLAQSGYPGTDYVDGDHTSATVQQTLDDYAKQDIETLAAPTETWSCEIRIAGPGALAYAPDLASWQLGDAPLFALSNHPWLPDGTYRRRVLGYSQASASSIKLTLAETPETV